MTPWHHESPTCEMLLQTLPPPLDAGGAVVVGGGALVVGGALVGVCTGVVATGGAVLLGGSVGGVIGPVSGQPGSHLVAHVCRVTIVLPGIHTDFSLVVHTGSQPRSTHSSMRGQPCPMVLPAARGSTLTMPVKSR